jgi:hypothetical protein
VARVGRRHTGCHPGTAPQISLTDSAMFEDRRAKVIALRRREGNACLLCLAHRARACLAFSTLNGLVAKPSLHRGGVAVDLFGTRMCVGQCCVASLTQVVCHCALPCVHISPNRAVSSCQPLASHAPTPLGRRDSQTLIFHTALFVSCDASSSKRSS